MIGASTLQGRAAPLAALDEALTGALAGRGALAIVTGEAGIGKTAIATAIAREAEARGAAVVWGRAWEFAEAPPYFPIAPCLRALGVAPHGDAFRLWEEVLAALARAPAPVVWIVEDVHAADLGTLDLLTFLAQPLRAMQVLVVATARERDPRITERMLQRLARMTRDGVELRLERLGDREVGALVEATTGRALPPAALAHLVHLTGGNPLFVVECARAFRGSGGTEGALASLPPTVRQVVNDRVALLPDAAREALAAGAVLGREFAAATVARMMDALPSRAIDALLPALRAGIVRESVPGQFVFSHTLVRDAVEDGLAADARAALHGRAEAALAGDAPDVIIERARHALAAGRADRAAETLALVARAAELLEREGAFDRVFELHAKVDAARAAGLLPPADPATRLHAARIARAAGRGDVARRLGDALVATARDTGDAVLLAQAALLQASDVRPGVVDHAQVALIEEARAALGERAPALGCRVLARLATALQPTPDPEPAEMAREARARALAIGDPALIVEVMATGGWGISATALDERVAWATELRDRALAIAELRAAMVADVWLTYSRFETGDFDALDRDVAGMLAAADELGHPRDRWRALLAASMQAASAGAFAVSDRYVTEVEQSAPLVDDAALALSLPLHLVMRDLALRRDDELRIRLAGLDAVIAGMVNAAGETALLRGLCAARRGDLDEARAQLAVVITRRPLAAIADEAFSSYDPVFAYVAELVAFAGDDAQRRLATTIIDRFANVGVSGGPLSFSYDGPADRVRGLCAAAVGDHAAAEIALRRALELSRARGHAPWVAQISFELARVVGVTEGRTLAAESARLARALGMTGLAGAVLPAGPLAPDEPLRLERAGADWRIARGAAEITLRDSRGVQLLARLIERPGEEIHVLALASDDGAAAPESSAGDLLDDQARKTYRRRLGELGDALAEAEQRGDARRALGIERERDALVKELARATGLGGKARVSSSTTERARINVQKRLKEALGRVAEADAELGRFLEAAVRTGTYCCFRP